MLRRLMHKPQQAPFLYLRVKSELRLGNSSIESMNRLVKIEPRLSH